MNPYKEEASVHWSLYRLHSDDAMLLLLLEHRLMMCREKRLCECRVPQKLSRITPKDVTSVQFKYFFFFKTIELPLYQNCIVDPMRMYLGHICTVVLSASCHPHCLSCLAFTCKYYRTKLSFSCWLSPHRGDAMYGFMFNCLFAWYQSNTDYLFPPHACVICALQFCVNTCICSLKSKFPSEWMFLVSHSCVPYVIIALYAFI